MNRRISYCLSTLVLALLLASCSIQAPNSTSGSSPAEDRSVQVAPEEGLPGEGAVDGWVPAGQVQKFDAENLFDLVDGQADAFFAYAFEQVATRDYEDADGQVLRIEIWQLETPEGAYGLFTSQRAGTPVPYGNDGDADPGRRLVFWQDRYVVQLFALQELPDADLYAFAEEVAGALPVGGEPPILLDRLPQDGLRERETIFFQEEISIQSYLWLGGENLLGLGPETYGLLARYDLDGGPAMLLLVQYSDAGAAASGRDALLGGEVEDLALTESNENLLGAVFGMVDAGQARALLQEALRDN